MCTAFNEKWLKSEMNTTKKLYFVTSVVIINSIQIGFIFGWISPILSKLQFDYNFDSSKSSWLASVISITSAFGTTLTAILTRNFGRRLFILIATLLNLSSWILIMLNDNFVQLMVARLIAGFGAGISSIIVPLYITEITTNAIRGKLSVVMISSINIGTFIMYSIGPKLSIRLSALISAMPLVYTLAFFYYVPESPLYYLLKNNYDKAEKSLKKLRCSDMIYIRAELDGLKESHLDHITSKSECEESVFQAIISSNNRRAFVICFVLFTGHALCGSILFIFFPHLIFDKANGLFSANTSSLIFSGLQFLSAITSSFYVDSLGRKPLLIISCFGCAFSMFLEFIYFYLQFHNVKFIEQLSWMPLSNAICLQISTSIGLAQIPTIYLFEIFPAHLKAIYGCIISIYFNFLMFFITKSFQFFTDYFPMYIIFLIFSIINICTGIFTIYFVPETKGQSFQEIRNKF